MTQYQRLEVAPAKENRWGASLLLLQRHSDLQFEAGAKAQMILMAIQMPCTAMGLLEEKMQPLPHPNAMMMPIRIPNMWLKSQVRMDSPQPWPAAAQTRLTPRHSNQRRRLPHRPLMPNQRWKPERREPRHHCQGAGIDTLLQGFESVQDRHLQQVDPAKASGQNSKG